MEVANISAQEVDILPHLDNGDGHDLALGVMTRISRSHRRHDDYDRGDPHCCLQERRERRPWTRDGGDDFERRPWQKQLSIVQHQMTSEEKCCGIPQEFSQVHQASARRARRRLQH